MVLTLLLFNAGCVKSQDALEVSELRCEYQKTPLGIDTLKPRLSWVITGKDRGIIQGAYQVLVASSKADLETNKGDMWDSGKVMSDRSAQVVYAGKELVSSGKYYWKVRVWDKTGKAFSYSKSAWWEMGLLNPEDWAGKWIEPEGGIPAFTYQEEFVKVILG